MQQNGTTLLYTDTVLAARQGLRSSDYSCSPHLVGMSLLIGAWLKTLGIMSLVDKTSTQLDIESW